jgi:hypothetical protein
MCRLVRQFHARTGIPKEGTRKLDSILSVPRAHGYTVIGTLLPCNNVGQFHARTGIPLNAVSKEAHIDQA